MRRWGSSAAEWHRTWRASSRVSSFRTDRQVARPTLTAGWLGWTNEHAAVRLDNSGPVA